MFRTFFFFELRYRLVALMVWIFLAILTFILFSVLITDEPMLEDVFFSSTLKNSPFVIQRLYGMTAVFGCLMVAAFVNSAATRDFAYNADQIIFTKPVSKFGYLFGRFCGATIISLIPMLGASLAVFIAQMVDSGPRWGPTYWGAHLWAILIFAIPNTFFVSAVIFAIAVWTRSTLASFLGILGLMLALSVSGALLGSLSNEFVAAMADPFGDTALALMTRYWTIADKNTQYATLTGPLLWNRLLWIGVGSVIFATAYWRFSFTTRKGIVTRFFTWFKESIDESLAVRYHSAQIPTVSRSFKLGTRIRLLIRLSMMEIWTAAKSPVFVCLLAGVFLNLMASLSVQAAEGFGLSALPVTFRMIDIVRGSISQFHIVFITFYAGVFVWREREAKVDEIIDVTPTPTWLPFLAKLFALILIVVSVNLIGIFSGLTYQLMSLFFQFKMPTYFVEFLIIDTLTMAYLAVLALLCHIVSPNRYVGYFLFIAVFIVNAITWPLLEVQSRLFQFGRLPSYTFSDFFHRQPYLPSLFWFAVYWSIFTAILGVVSVLLWKRGRDTGVMTRVFQGVDRWQGSVRLASIALALAFAACFGWIYWNTEVRNTYDSADQQEIDQASYEKKYKPYSLKPQPRVTKVKTEIDLFPHERRLEMRGTQYVTNKHDEEIESMILLLQDNLEVNVSVEKADLKEHDQDLNVMTFEFKPPLQPGETREVSFDAHYEPKGFENRLQMGAIVQNGTFFNSTFAPIVGYQPQYELQEKKKREEYDLPPIEVDEPSRDPTKRTDHYVAPNSDWVEIETVFSTSSDQIAVAPGSLVRKWEEDGRNYFHYKVDHPSLNFYSFVSADFEVKTKEWNGISLEVYYHPEHDWNVDRMLNSIEKSLDYYTKNFGPYEHKQARIVEFPRTRQFAQAFPGTMPYSEGVGFVADINKQTDIDMVFYVVAHEMAHQWWAHQVIGANMNGATLLSETLSQYSALMVMEEEYGRDMMQRFLAYEMDNYLRQRGREEDKERALVNVKSSQGYIHYNKGSIAMYQLKEAIGEEKLNKALHSFVEEFAYKEPPYPTSYDLIDAIRAETPEEFQTLVDDLFEKITLFDNRTTEASLRELEDGQYEVTMTVEFKKLYADEEGKETEAKLDDWIEIGAFSRPGLGKQYGTVLYRDRIHVTEPKMEFTFKLDKRPARVGVDPFSLLVDRNKQDNSRQPEFEDDED